MSTDSDAPDTMASSIDTIITHGDTTIVKSIGKVDTLISKDEKYKKDTTIKHEAPDHQSPDEAKLDSIKNAKKKKKND